MALTKVTYSMIQGSPVSVFDYMTPAEIADVQSGTPTLDVSTAIQTAVSTGKSVYFPSGVYGLITGFSIGFNGQRVFGAGPTNNIVPTAIRGTKFKRLSGVVSPLVLIVGDNGIFEGFSFDNNDAVNAVCAKFTAHGLTVRDLDFYKQAGGEVSLHLDSVNTSNYYNIFASNIRITETLYTNFYGIGLGGGLPGNVLYINGGAIAGTEGCQHLNFFGIWLENSNNTSSIRIDDNVTNCHFFDIRGELGATMVTALVDINGDKNGLGVYLCRNITFDGFVFSITSGIYGDAAPYFKISNAQNISIRNAYFKDTTSSAGLKYIVLDRVQFFEITNAFAYGGNTYNFIYCNSNCQFLTARNCNQFESIVGTMVWRGSVITVENTNMAQAFVTGADNILMNNVSGTINLTNSVSQTLINSGATNIPADGSTVIIANGSVRTGIATVASATNLILTGVATYFVVTGTTNITSIASGSTIIGRNVTLEFADVLTVTDGNNLKLAGNFITTAGDTLTLFCDGTDWYEQARSVN
jgi:hypothetical protein